MHPINSQSDSPLYNLNKYKNILKGYVKDENNNAKNFTTFSNYMENVPIEDNNIMVSFHAISLYTNIPKNDASNIFKNSFNKDDQISRKTTIPHTKFLDRVNLVLINTCYTFNFCF